MTRLPPTPPTLSRREAGRLIAAGPAMLLLPGALTADDISVAHPRVEWRTDPVGIDTVRPRFRWTLRSNRPRAVLQRAFRLRLVGKAGSGDVGRTIVDSGWVTSSVPQWQPLHALPLRSLARYHWEIALETGDGTRSLPMPAGSFVTGMIHAADWQAQWIAAGPDDQTAVRAREWHRPITGPAQPLPILRGQFVEHRQVQAAFLSVIGLGQYALAIGGRPVGAEALLPAWSDFTKTLYYDTFDVTALIQPGVTIISAMLGNGFFAAQGVTGRYTKFIGSFGRPRLLLQLRMIFADGEQRIVRSDANWSYADGPIVFSSIFGGEDHDARCEPLDWRVAINPPSQFRPVTILPPLAARLAASPLQPVAVVRTVASPLVTEHAEGASIADFGINFAGRPRIALVDVAAGTIVAMKPGELLAKDGLIDQASATGGGKPGYKGISFNYTVGSAPPPDGWAPRFTYTGFRYLQIENVRPAQIRALSGEVMHLTSGPAGQFDCSDRRLVDIHLLIRQAFLSNLASVLTDCPHREKLGWLEQSYLNATTAFYNSDCAALYEKIAADMRDAQSNDGRVPTIAPEFVAFVRRDGRDTDFRDSPEWGCAIVLAPWAAYRFYGDLAILADTYPAMERYVAYLSGRAQDSIVDYGLGDWFDIGPNRPGKAQLTSRAFTGTATLLAVLSTMARISDVLRRPGAAANYRRRAVAVKAAIDHHFLDSSLGRYDRGSQTAQAMALSLNIPSIADRPRVLAGLINDIAARDHHISAGDVGFHYVVDALMRERQAETLYAVLTRTDAPSYLAQMASGATALTEAWDGAPHASQNHFMLGQAEGWLFSGLGGVGMDFGQTNGPIRFAPQPVSGVEWSDVTLATVLGEARCVWQRRDTVLSVDVTVPPGARATITLPSFYSEHNGSALDGSGLATTQLHSGQHRFVIPIRPV